MAGSLHRRLTFVLGVGLVGCNAVLGLDPSTLASGDGGSDVDAGVVPSTRDAGGATGEPSDAGAQPPAASPDAAVRDAASGPDAIAPVDAGADATAPVVDSGGAADAKEAVDAGGGADATARVDASTADSGGPVVPPDSGVAGEPDAASVPCAACPSGQICVYPESQGCSAVGECVPAPTPGVTCQAIELGCFCDGTSANIVCNGLPGGTASKPLRHTGACP